MATPILSHTTFNGFPSLNHNLTTSKNNVCQHFGALRLSLSTPRTSKHLQSNYRITRKFIVRCNNVEPGPPNNSNSSNFKGWIVGIVASVILPLLFRKFRPLMQLKNKVEKAIYTAEEIVGNTEEVAETVENVAENVAGYLPAGKLKDSVESIESVAEKVEKGAEVVEDFIDKVEEVGDKVGLLEEIEEKKADEPAEEEKD